jgi:hypothetical protein
MGAAFERLRAALATCSRDMRVVGGKLVVSCPGPGHWRGDQVPSMVVSNGDGKALIDCHAGCNTEDIVSVLGLTMADLFDEPRQPAPGAPGARRLGNAIGKARGLSLADRYVYLWLLRLADWDTATIPLRFQPRSQRELAAACGADLDTVKQATAHLHRHQWLTLSCGADGCDRPVPHPGRGHRIIYTLPGIGEDCPRGSCRTKARKGGTRPLLRVVNAAGVAAVITLMSVGGAGPHPPPTSLQHKPALDLRVSASESPFSSTAVPPFSGGAS